MDRMEAYEGDQSYIFISYAHADEPEVARVLERMKLAGCRFWYDEGIEAGHEWPEYIARRLSGAELMIAFISDAYAASGNCRKEMHYAITKGIRTINVFLERAEMTPGLELQIGNIFALMKYSMSEETFYEKFFAAINSAPSDPPSPSAPEASDTAPKAGQGKAGRKKTALRRLLMAAAAVALLALLICGVLFIPSNISAKKNLTYTREEAIDIAFAALGEQIGEESAKDFYVDYAARHLRYKNGIFEADYYYSVEFQDQLGNEYRYRVNASSGYAELREIDIKKSAADGE